MNEAQAAALIVIGSLQVASTIAVLVGGIVVLRRVQKKADELEVKTKKVVHAARRFTEELEDSV